MSSGYSEVPEVAARRREGTEEILEAARIGTLASKGGRRALGLTFARCWTYKDTLCGCTWCFVCGDKRWLVSGGLTVPELVAHSACARNKLSVRATGLRV